MRLKPIARTAVDILAIDVIDPWLRKSSARGEITQMLRRFKPVRNVWRAVHQSVGKQAMRGNADQTQWRN
jgi:hypothetical protein